MSPSGVVLDCDGTLVDTESADVAAHAAEYARSGLPPDHGAPLVGGVAGIGNLDGGRVGAGRLEAP